MSRPDALRPGDLALSSLEGDLPLFDVPDHVGRMTVRSPLDRRAPRGTVLTVIALLYDPTGHEQVLVLLPSGAMGWCWGGYLERVT